MKKKKLANFKQSLPTNKLNLVKGGAGATEYIILLILIACETDHGGVGSESAVGAGISTP